METYQENTVYNLVGKVTIYTSLFFFLLSQCLRCFEEKYKLYYFTIAVKTEVLTERQTNRGPRLATPEAPDLEH